MQPHTHPSQFRFQCDRAKGLAKIMDTVSSLCAHVYKLLLLLMPKFTNLSKQQHQSALHVKKILLLSKCWTTCLRINNFLFVTLVLSAIHGDICFDFNMTGQQV